MASFRILGVQPETLGTGIEIPQPSKSFSASAATAFLALSLVAGQANANPDGKTTELSPGHTTQDIIVPMWNDGPNTIFKVIRDGRGIVTNPPLATKNADGTYTLLDGRPCPPGRTERACHTANKIVLQSIINEQDTIPLVQPIIAYSKQSTITALAFEELRVPGSIARFFGDRESNIKKEDVPKLKTFKDGLPLLAQLAKNLPAWEILAKQLDALRGTTIEMKGVDDMKESYLKYMTLAGEKPQNIVASK